MPDFPFRGFVSRNLKDLEESKTKPKAPEKEIPNVAANEPGREPEWGVEGGVHMRLSPEQTLKRWDRLCGVLAQASLSSDDPEERPEGVAQMQKRIAKMVKSHRQENPLPAKAKPAARKR